VASTLLSSSVVSINYSYIVIYVAIGDRGGAAAIGKGSYQPSGSQKTSARHAHMYLLWWGRRNGGRLIEFSQSGVCYLPFDGKFEHWDLG